jgi:hypothetical protein
MPSNRPGHPLVELCWGEPPPRYHQSSIAGTSSLRHAAP